MGKTHEWSPTSRGKALGLRATGTIPLCEITNIIGIPKFTVDDISTCGTGINKPRSGHPRKLSSRDIRQLIRYIKTNKYTRRVFLNQLKKLFRLDVHENTIRAALKEHGIHHRVARHRPFLNNRDKK